jgi:hypothetical protein
LQGMPNYLMKMLLSVYKHPFVKNGLSDELKQKKGCLVS